MSEETKGEVEAVQTEEALDVQDTVSQEQESIAEIESVFEDKKDEKKSLGKKIASTVFELAIYLLIIVFCIIVVPRYIIQRTEVSGPSMENTLQDEDNIMVEKLSYRFGKPERFDIIVFYHFYDEQNQDKNDEECYDFYVKRIIGLPGETVQIVDDTIYINGKALKENYGKDPIAYQGVASEPFTLDKDEYFVLGDNREVSQDSRYEEVGNIKRDQIVGRAWLRVYPFGEFGFLED